MLEAGVEGNGSSISGVALAISQLIVNGQVVVNTLLVAFDLGGTFVFALSGASTGVKNRLVSDNVGGVKRFQQHFRMHSNKSAISLYLKKCRSNQRLAS